MCVQYLLAAEYPTLIAEFDAYGDPFVWKPHIFPKYPAPVVIQRDGKNVIVPMQFGLIPPFEKNEPPKMVFHNARVETVAEKASFRGPIKKSRCLVPLEHFFEYVDRGQSRKTLLKFASSKGGLLAAAGIYSRWVSPSGSEVDTFSIITTDATPYIRDQGHDRCPVFLRKERRSQWLEPRVLEPEELLIMAAGSLETELVATEAVKASK